MEALKLSEYILYKCTEDKCPITNLQLQKILFLIQEEYFKTYNIKYFNDDIEVWMFGPVVANVYYYYCGSGANTIKNFNEPNIIIKNKKFIDTIIEENRELLPWELLEKIEERGYYWNKTYNNERGNKKIIKFKEN